MFDDQDLSALLAEALGTIELHTVETAETTIYCLDEEQARDKVLALALCDRLAFMTTEIVPAADVWVERDGWIVVEQREIAR
jgi:hypothetical protein